ncbi:MAG: hypothetical protein KGZ66_05535 [Selenomonadales bacterium]|jgi:proteic killer suppression protein/toxin YoeB|nr:hypothetical protein [Selenomonadales bacterium]
MLVEYEAESVRKVFTDLAVMQRKIGSDMARTTKKRLDQLRAAPNFGAYMATGLGRPHPLVGGLKGYFAIGVTGNVRLIVKPHSALGVAETLHECDAVIVKGVVDYHGGKNEWLVP